MLLFAVAMPGPAWTAAVNSRRTTTTTHFRPRFSVSSVADGLGFPSFLPKEVEGIKDPYARKLASRIQRLPVTVGSSGDCIMSSCVMPLSSTQSRATTSPMVLLHGFDRPIILVGPSLGAAIAIDFAVQYPEAVEKLVLIDASVYAEGTGGMATLPRTVAYAGIGRLHCTYHWWADATVNFMRSGGYDVARLIPKINQKTLIIWGEDDKIISSKLGVRLHCELPNAIIRQIPNCGHIPHVEKPSSVAKLIKEFVQDQEDRSRKEDQLVGTPVS
ncbi:unnamed protein product [Linum tenue]|uniref:AB hydrolase-1 domain-containing protein n=1 Tax=Linum tenue TaxID=586396 RepID=A0AAV0HZJ2_9ROSI|nr:unnamed protein product [Linum tenue]